MYLIISIVHNIMISKCTFAYCVLSVLMHNHEILIKSKQNV